MIDVLRSKNLWRLVKGDQTKPTNVKDLEKWEDQIDKARGFIGKTISDNLQIHIEVRISPLRYGKP